MHTNINLLEIESIEESVCEGWLFHNWHSKV
jgi:hypothetical protein